MAKRKAWSNYRPENLHLLIFLYKTFHLKIFLGYKFDATPPFTENNSIISETVLEIFKNLERSYSESKTGKNHAEPVYVRYIILYTPK